jgi:long-subunit fatty acid transport protein
LAVFRRNDQLTLCLTIVFLSAQLQPVHAAVNGLEEIGHSWQADMRGGTEVAVGDTALSQVRQPASVVLHSKVRFDSKLTNIFPVNKFNGPLEGDVYRVPDKPNFALAVVGPINKSSGWGFSVFSKTSWDSAFRGKFLLRNKIESARGSVLNYAAQLNAGHRLTEKLSVGGGGRVELMKTGSSAVFGPAKMDLGGEWSVGGGFNLGALYQVRKNTILGFGYRSPTWLGPSGRGVIDLTDGRRFQARVPLTRNVLPQRVMLGVSCRPTDKIMLACEGTWVNYQYSLFGKTKVRSALPLEFPAQMKDILIAGVGCDYELTKNWGISGGYTFNTNPVARSDVMPTFGSNTQNTLSCGLRYKRDRWWAGVAYDLGLPNWTRNNDPRHIPRLGVDYGHATLKNMMQSVTYGVGCFL